MLIEFHWVLFRIPEWLVEVNIALQGADELMK